MKVYQIVDRGDGPKIEGTRITVYTVLDYAKNGRSREWIASMLDLSSRQVQAALDYIEQHRAEVESDYQRIVARIERGNSPWVEEKLKQAREKFQNVIARHQQATATHREAHGG